MNEKFIERPKKFNQRAYNDTYQKEHYSSFSARVKPELKERIDEYCSNTGISKSEFLKKAMDLLENS